MAKSARISFIDFLLPITLVFGAKYISVFVLNILLGLNWGFGFSPYQIFGLPFFQYTDSRDLLVVNSISTVFMTLVLAVGYLTAFYRFQYFHENFVGPKVSARLHSKKMEYLIFSETRAHTQITVWFALAWVIFLLTLLEFLAGTMALVSLSLNIIIVMILGAAAVTDMHKKGSMMGKRR